MIVDEYDFEKTARAVLIMNDSAREIYDSWEELKDFMVSMAYTYRDCNHFGTGGFVLTFFDGHNDLGELLFAGVIDHGAEFLELAEQLFGIFSR